MSHNPNLPPDQRFSLAPLGRDMGIFEFPRPGGGDEARHLVAGYTIYDKFLPLFNRLGGEGVVGRPLTEVHRNAEKSRYEQYFENIGFYWVDGDDQNAIYLLAYGAWKCDHYCRHTPPQNAAVLLPGRASEVFMRAVAGLGLDFTGVALTPPYIGAGGYLEQIYENVVLVASADDPSVARLVALPEKIGIQQDVLLPPFNLEGTYFYPVQGQLGYNVPDYFIEYIKEHGGLDLVGAPITQLISLEGGFYRQCFKNLCLQRQPDATGAPVIRPVSLGPKYRALYYIPESTALESAPSSDVTVQIWEGYPMVSPDQEQEIGVVVLGGAAPLENVLPVLEMTLPDGGRQSYTLPPTDRNGESRLVLPALGAENGTLIPYKICVAIPNSQRFCVMDSYLIWRVDYSPTSPTLEPGSTAYLPFLLQNFEYYFSAVVDVYLPFLAVQK